MTKKLPVSEQDRRNRKKTQQLNKMFAEVNKAWRENKKSKRNNQLQEIETMTKSEKMRLEEYYLTLHSATVEAIREIGNEATNREGTLEKEMVTAEQAIQVIKDLDSKMMQSFFPSYPSISSLEMYEDETVTDES